jgi:serine/threonine protein phosphatase 1
MRYAIGDIHGCYQTLFKLVDQTLNLTKQDELYFVGDFIDRGPGSRQVVDYILELKEAGYRVYAVKGNHEEMLLDAWMNKTPDSFMLWMMNGAAETLVSYDIQSYLHMDEACLNELPEEHVDFFRKMPYYIETDDHIIVHAGINFKADKPFEDTASMVWCRDCTNDTTQSGNRIIVNGHTPTPLDVIRKRVKKKNPKEINIDAGCVYKGYTDMGNLVALDLDNHTLYWEENIDF